VTNEELTELERLCEGATAGPWALGHEPWGRYVNDGSGAGIYADGKTPVGKCRDCKPDDPLVHEATHEETGQRYHLHKSDTDGALVEPDPHRIHSRATWQSVCGNYDYECGGVVREVDARLIVAVVNALPRLIARVRELEGAERRAYERAASACRAVADEYKREANEYRRQDQPDDAFDAMGHCNGALEAMRRVMSLAPAEGKEGGW
jgi:hypothetical protein